jgi:hypothetical protein
VGGMLRIRAPLHLCWRMMLKLRSRTCSKRAREMLKTAEKALEYTRANQGKHFIGDFLPKEEVSEAPHAYIRSQACAAVMFCIFSRVQLERLKKEAEAVRRGETYVREDFADNKLDASNKGFNMLQKAGMEAAFYSR